MLTWIRRAAPLVAIAILGLAANAAQAASVTFSTSGAFTAAGSDQLISSTELRTGSGDTALSFFARSSETWPAPSAPGEFVELGTFVLLGIETGEAHDSFDANSSFTLTINQSDPLGVGGSSSSISGFIDYTLLVNGDSAELSLIFDPNPVEIAGMRYAIQPFEMTGNFTAQGGVVGTLVAQIVPLPAAAWGGMALFGVLGGAKLRRSRQLA